MSWSVSCGYVYAGVGESISALGALSGWTIGCRESGVRLQSSGVGRGQYNEIVSRFFIENGEGRGVKPLVANENSTDAKG